MKVNARAASPSPKPATTQCNGPPAIPAAHTILRRPHPLGTLRIDNGHRNDLSIAKDLVDKLAAVQTRQKAVIATLKTRSLEARAKAMNPGQALNRLRSPLGLEATGTEDAVH